LAKVIFLNERTHDGHGKEDNGDLGGHHHEDLIQLEEEQMLYIVISTHIYTYFYDIYRVLMTNRSN
jgi:hypothetical protein